MPDVYLKNELGEDIAYEGVDTITLRQVGGGTVRYTCGLPTTSEKWQYVQNYLDNSAKTSNWNKYYATCKVGRVISSSQPNFGTWLQTTYDAFRISSTTFTCVFAVPGGILLSTQSYNAPIYLFDEVTCQLTKIANTGGYIQFVRPIGNGNIQFIIGPYCWQLYDPATKTFTVLKSEGSNSLGCYCLDVGDGLLLSTTNTASACCGLYFFNYEDYSLTKVFNEGSYWMIQYRPITNTDAYYTGVFEVPDGWLISSASNSVGCTGILFYDKATHEVTRLSSSGYYYFQHPPTYAKSYDNTYVRIMDDGVAITSGSAGNGLWWFKFSDRSLTQISQTGYYSRWVETEDALIATYSSYGCSVYDKINKIWYNPITTGQYNCVAFVEGGCVIGGNSGSYGVKYYDAETGTLTQLDSTYSWYYACKTPDGCLLSNSSSGIWKFKKEDMSFTKVYETGYYWKMYRHGDTILIGSYTTGADGFLIYKDDTFTFYYLNYNDKGMRCVLDVQGGWIICGSYSSSGRGYFVDDTTCEVTYLGDYMYNLGPYFANWYGPNYQNHKPSYCFNKKFGDFRFLWGPSSSYGLIYDEVNHTLVDLYYWYSGNAQPETTPTSTRHFRISYPSFYEMGDNRVLILSTNTYPPVLLNYETGKVYVYQSLQLYAGNTYDKAWQPTTQFYPVDGGKLIFVPPYDWERSTSPSYGCTGVFYFDDTTARLTRLYDTEYYDTYEETAGGGYLYLEPTKFINKLYWNEETHTITRIIEE